MTYEMLMADLVALASVVIVDPVLAGDNAVIIGMAAGLLLSIVLMAAVAASIARLLDRHSWFGYLGLMIVLFVAAGMIHDGAKDIAAVIAAQRSREASGFRRLP